MTEFYPLSRREREVAIHLFAGKSNKFIASALGISESTVEFHLRNIYAKYQVGSRVELILKLRESIVAGEELTAENRDRLDLRDWAAAAREAVARIGEEVKMQFSNTNARGEGNTMTFFESIRVCLNKYAEFSGRASRPEFWWFTLFVTLAASALALLNEVFSSLFLVAILLPFLAVGSRRLRDSGKSAWWLFFLLVPVGGIILLGFLWALPPADPQEEETIPA